MAGDGLYLAAGKILDQLRAGRGAVRTLCYASSITNKKALIRLVLETAHHFHLLARVLRAASFRMPGKMGSNESLLLVLLQDFLFPSANASQTQGPTASTSSFKCSPETKSHFEASKTRLRAELVKARLALKREGLPEGFSAAGSEDSTPRYVRINRLLVRTEEEFNSLLESLKSLNYTWDPHVPELLVFSPGTDLTRHPAYCERHHLILQDKASCFPPVVLAPPTCAHVIDACAAPGNKTSQLCAMVGLGGRVFAFERDPRRYETLCRLTSEAGATPDLLHPRLGDFLAINPEDPQYAQVQYVLCDPSCSGSGMPMSLERAIAQHETRHDSKSNDRERLKQLSKFQISILKHAMRFPAVKRVVYSTCSIHNEENEEVVQELLKHNPHFRLVQGILPNWPRRGCPEYQFAADVVRADAALDGTNGFFVALFERKNSPHSL